MIQKNFPIDMFTVVFYGCGLNSPATVKVWNRTSVQNLVRHKSGRYYARVFANGKETWKSLKTDLLEVAKVKLREISGLIQKAPMRPKPRSVAGRL